MADTKDMWSAGRVRDRVTAAAYDFGVEHEPLARVGGALMWGADARLLFRSIQRLSETPPGAWILDLPCGGGVAFRGLDPGQDNRYVAADLSPFMLRRARATAARLGLTQIEFRQADVEALPFANEQFDLILTYSGLHCFPDPQLALCELARCLKPGGALRGDCAVRGQRGLSDGLIRLYQRAGIFGPAGEAAEVDAWVETAGLSYVEHELSGAVLFFEARKPTARAG